VGNLIQIVFVVGALAVFVWMLASKSASDSGAHSTGDHFIDPADSRQLATLIGMAGGNIKDAAVAKFAVERFRQQNGRLPTTREIGTLIGIMRSMS
jgi:hypothetical protein